MLNPMELVRASTELVCAQSSLVELSPSGIEALAQSIDPAEVAARYRWSDDFHYQGDIERCIDFIFTVDTINFGSGFSPEWKANRPLSTYQWTAEILKRRLQRGEPLGCAFASAITSTELTALYQAPAHFPLMEMWAEALNQLGRWVESNFGSYQGLLASLPHTGRGAAFVKLLTENLPAFRDEAYYGDERVYFYKRAQIMVNDLSLALGGQGLGYFDDRESLTMFADNLVPHVLRIEGALHYESSLLDKINRGEFLAAGSAEEVEIRSAGVQGVELLVQALRRKANGMNLTPAMVDVYLWNRGQDQRFKSQRRHLTRTTYY